MKVSYILAVVKSPHSDNIWIVKPIIFHYHYHSIIMVITAILLLLILRSDNVLGVASLGACLPLLHVVETSSSFGTGLSIIILLIIQL